MKDNKPSAPRPVYPIRQRLTIAWWLWLVYRLAGIGGLGFCLTKADHNTTNTSQLLVASLLWQLLWLIPALVSTPFIIKGKNAYALLLISMLLLVYFGASAMLILKYMFSDHLMLGYLWLVDCILLALVNYWLFILLKRLPKMNG